MGTTLTDATDGMLQDGTGTGGCVKVVAREHETVTVVAVPDTNTVARAPNAAVVARSQPATVVVATSAAPQRVVSQQTQTVVASSGCNSSPGSGGVSSYLDLTDVPTEFPPEAHEHTIEEVAGLQIALDLKAAALHTHAISDVTGLSGRIFASAATYTFDIDAANADEGVTDPYKFKTVYGACASIFSIVGALKPDQANRITLLLGDGEYPAWHFAYLISYGQAGGWDYIYDGLNGLIEASNVHLVVTTKSTPTVINNNEWTLIASQAVDAATRAAAAAANKALIQSRFPVRVVRASGEPYWQGQYLLFPINCTLDGVAFVSDDPGYIYLKLPQLGVKPVVAFQTWNWYVDKPVKPPLLNLFTRAPYNLENARCYVVHGHAELHALGPTNDAFYLTMVNTTGPITQVHGVVHENTSHATWGVFCCLGNNNASSKGWLSISPINRLAMSIKTGSVVKSGEPFIVFNDVPFRSGAFALSYSGVTATGATLINSRHAPVYVSNRSVLAAAYTLNGGFVQCNIFATNVQSAKQLFGTGSPNGVIIARPGDIYTNQSGGANTTLWVKESGSDTNTGWVAK